MEEKNVDIAIQSLQRRSEGDELIREKVAGTLRREGKGWLLCYREGESSGLGDTVTTLRLEEGKATLTRTGETASQMVFRVGQTCACQYATAYGELSMTIAASKLEWELDEAGGKVFLVYKLQLEGAEAGETRLRLTVKTKENGYDR